MFSDRTSLILGSAVFVGLLGLYFLGLKSSRPAAAPPSPTVPMSTWSIVAADPATGDVGVAAASCVADLPIDALAALVPGKGAAATQAQYSQENRDKAYDLLQAGLPADDIIEQLSDLAGDALVDRRQYGVVTIGGGQVGAVAFTGEDNPDWAGSQQDVDSAVTVQGNTLASEAVVIEALQAFQRDDPQGHNALPDRLMRALEAGSAAGGDARCNNDQVQQTAATAVILVARGTDQPYAAEAIGLTDAGTPRAPWLAISVTEPIFGPNPILELRARHDLWRVDNIGDGGTGLTDPLLVAAIALAIAGLALAVGSILWRRRA